ncbi:elongation factor P [Altererythrobacter aestiaquae]|uniref:Elongation factor P n=2 Tax=Pontixanthobacter aestiaquae TaxID=1509367 RepID=A0A844Z419_9SPHN|nr:elongation factor P [Pontixanthobacter aestiaquae]
MPASSQDRMGRLGTLPHGFYVCSLPGDAGGAAWIDLPDKNFTISNASTYRNAEGAGTYLLTGKRVTFTGGPLKGMRFDRTGKSKLQWIANDGKPGRIRCVRRGGSG